MNMRPTAICFDAYGTLFDVYSIGVKAEALFPGKGARLAAVWRDKQVEYTRLRSMAGQYVPFWDITVDALRFCCESLGLVLGRAQEEALMAQYSRLSPFPENLQALQRMREAGIRLAIHSNGNPEMIAKAVESAGMSGVFETVLSAHQVRRYKIDAEVYQLAPDYFGCTASDLLFVSSNNWDVCGAAWFGFTTFWVNRAGAPREQLGVAPHYEGASLVDVADLVVDVKNH
jgi:2-haloacid dehalogenase